MVAQYESGDYKKNYYSIVVDDLIGDFASLPPAADTNSKLYIPEDTPRRFALHVVSTDYYGRKNTGICFLNSPRPNISSATFTVGQYVSIRPEIDKTSGVFGIDVYLSNQEDFDIAFTGVFWRYLSTFPRRDQE